MKSKKLETSSEKVGEYRIAQLGGSKLKSLAFSLASGGQGIHFENNGSFSGKGAVCQKGTAKRSWIRFAGKALEVDVLKSGTV